MTMINYFSTINTFIIKDKIMKIMVDGANKMFCTIPVRDYAN